jgi:hypothetical protein
VTLDEDTAQTRQILRQLRADATGALETIRDLARGIYRRCWLTWGWSPRSARRPASSPSP